MIAKFFLILSLFFALLTPVYPKIKIFNTTPRVIIVLHLYFENYDHIMHGCHFGPFFTSHPFLTTQKIIILKNKTPGDIIILHMCTINDNHMIWYMVPEIRSLTDRIFCHFGLLFFVFLFPLLTNQKTKVLTKWK